MQSQKRKKRRRDVTGEEAREKTQDKPGAHRARGKVKRGSIKGKRKRGGL